MHYVILVVSLVINQRVGPPTPPCNHKLRSSTQDHHPRALCRSKCFILLKPLNYTTETNHLSLPSEEMLAIELFGSSIDALMRITVPAQRQGLTDHEAREAVHRYCQKVMAETILRMSEVDHVLELPPNKRSKDGPEYKTGGTTQPWAEIGGAKAREKMARASEEQELGLEMEKLRLENARMAVEVKRLELEVEKVKMEAAVAAVDIAKAMAGAGVV